jgi:EPS-associated MarR family transcriptional regulator
LFKFERDRSARFAGSWWHQSGGSVLRSSKMQLKSKIQEEARFQILRYVHENPAISQRELSVRLGVSLGAVNYCLKALLDRGLVKIQNFSNNPNKVGYSYFLTRTGITEKTLLTARFLKRKKFEYDALKKEIAELSIELEQSARVNTEVEGT